MRVGHVVHHYGKLSESFIPDALEALEAAGAEAWVGTLSVANRPTYPFPPDERLLVCPAPLVRRAVDRLLGRSGTERFAGMLAERLRPVAPALVHAQFAWGAVTGVALARRLGVPATATFHGSDIHAVPVERPGADGWRGPAGHAYERMLAELDLALPVSRYLEGRLRALGYQGPAEIMPAGVNLDRMPFRGEEPDASVPVVLFIGRLVPQKGLAVLLEALPEIRAAAPAVRLEVIGGGPQRSELEALAHRLGVGRAVVFHGALADRESIIAALRRAHVLAMPSRAMPDGVAEGSPVVTKEAQAIGVPVVATDTGGIAETVPPEHRAALVPGDDPAALARAVAALLGDPAARAERARAARAFVEAEFDAAQLARRTVALYARLAG